MNFAIIMMVLLPSISCTTLSPQTKTLLSHPIKPSHFLIQELEAVPGTEGDCGPQSLTMVLKWAGQPYSLQDTRKQTLTPKKKGSLPAHMVTASRSFGMLAIKHRTLSTIIQELKTGKPIIALLNLGLPILPVWHYVVIAGYDIPRQELTLFTGKSYPETMPMTYFERHWSLAHYWALQVLPPHLLSATADEISHLRAASGIEAANQLEAASIAYATILRKWPNSVVTHIGLGNIAYSQKRWKESASYFEQALMIDPQSSTAKNNLAVVKESLGPSQSQPEEGHH